MLAIKEIDGKGRGVVATAAIAEGRLIEQAPVATVPIGANPYDPPHVFPWDWERNAVAFGNISMCNHSYYPNAYWTLDDRHMTISLIAAKEIAVGDEITISYNCKLWFEAKP